MIKEALLFLEGLIERAQTPQKVKEHYDPREELYAIGGKLESKPTPIAPRAHRVKSLVEIIAFSGGIGPAWSPVVFASESEVVLVLDSNGHRVERVTFSLQASDIWDTVRKMGAWKSQKDFVRLLKIDLAGCLPENALLDTIRKVKFENGVTTVQEVKKNRESLGKEITAKVETPLEIPDYITLQCPVYKSLGETDAYPVQCSVEVDPTRTDAFRLAPLPDEIERVQYLAIDSILDRLKEGLCEGVPCYYGSP